METLLTQLENGILTITINRPDKLNALNNTVFEELNTLVNDIYRNPDIHGVIITGAGPKAFVAGADISEFMSLSTEEGSSLAKRGQDVFMRIENCRKPVIAAVNGFALGGGCELAMSCHIRIAATNAKFGQPEVNLGIIPGYGGTQRLAQLIGKGKAMELLMSAEMINAEQALQLGLVNHVTEPDQLMEKSFGLMNTILSKGPGAVGKVIAAVNAGYDNTANGYDEEVRLFGECFNTDEMKEGVTAFLEKRKAMFRK
ncbi:MAG: enoyl-CoA hydratase-related protein [Chitinophagaceae bacterium]